MINLTSTSHLILSLVSKVLGDDEFIFFIPNKGDLILDFISSNKYKLTVSLKDYDPYTGYSGNIRIYDNGNIYLIKNTFSNGIVDLKSYFALEIEGVSVDLRKFYEFKPEKASNGDVYKFIKKVI